MATAKTPREALTTKQVCDLPRDNVQHRNFWMLVDEVSVSVAEQKIGEASTGSVRISRAAFDRFVDWYQTGVWPQRRKQAR